MRVPRTYISRLERGITTPTLKSLTNIAGALEMTTEDLLDGKDTPHFNIELVRLLQSCPEEKRVGLEEFEHPISSGAPKIELQLLPKIFKKTHSRQTLQSLQ